MYHVYAYRKTRERIEACLADCFATGELMQCELWGEGIYRRADGWYEIRVKV